MTSAVVEMPMCELSDEELAARTEELVARASYLSMELRHQTELLASTLDLLARELKEGRGGNP